MAGATVIVLRAMNTNTKSAPTEHSRRHAGSVRAKRYGTVGAAMTSTGTTPTEYINIDTAAAYCGVSTKTLRRALRSRRLAFFKPGRSYMFTRRDLDAWMDASRYGVVVFGSAARNG